MAKEITLTFAPDGTSTVEASGFKGRACVKATQEFEEAIGNATARKNKPEMLMAEAVATVKQGG